MATKIYRKRLKVDSEPLLMKRFNECIERVRKSRNEKMIEDNSSNVVIYNVETKQDIQCSLCQNMNPNYFYTDYKSGDTICTGPNGTGCGNVLQDHIVNRGREHVTHEEETDKNHHGNSQLYLSTSPVSYFMYFPTCHEEEKDCFD